jgi:ABC-type dipeptide/oligopeptide/nickel transport system permease component
MMRMTPGDPVRLLLGPEATPEAITAKRVELGFQKYVGGTTLTADLIQQADDKVLLAIEAEPAVREQCQTNDEILVRVGDEGQAIPAIVVDPDATDIVKSEAVLYLQVNSHHRITDDAVEITLSPELVDRSIIAQYFTWIWKILVRRDMGTSITSGRPVVEEIGTRILPTIELAMVAMFFATLTGLIVGTLSAVYPRTMIDNVSRVFVFIFLAMPSFWLGLELIIVFSRNLELFPPADRGHIGHIVLPALTLGVGTGAFLSRILRSSMLQVLNMDYIRTAQAKGLPNHSVILKHGLKNAMIPFVTVSGLSLGALLGGSVIVETIFNWPGMGKLLIDSIKGRDFPVTMGCVLVLAAIFVLVNLAVDLLYVVLDPRIRLEGADEA